MPDYYTRPKDVKYYVEEAMRNLNYVTHSNYTNNMGDNECTVLYSDYDNAIETQESYHDFIWLKIIFSIKDNNSVPYRIQDILNYVSKYIEDCGADYCTAFQFGHITIHQPGTLTEVEMSCNYHMENDWRQHPLNEI